MKCVLAHIYSDGEPSDVAAAALFLCSAEAEFLTGVVMEVDGGRTI